MLSTVERLYKDTSEMRTSPLIRIPSHYAQSHLRTLGFHCISKAPLRISLNELKKSRCHIVSQELSLTVLLRGPVDVTYSIVARFLLQNLLVNSCDHWGDRRLINFDY